MLRLALLSTLLLLFAACSTTTEGDGGSEPRFAYLVVMEGEPTLNKGQFELVFRDGHLISPT